MCTCGSCQKCEDKDVERYARTGRIRKKLFLGRSKSGAPLTTEEQDYRVIFARVSRECGPVKQALLPHGTLAAGQSKLPNMAQVLGPLVEQAAAIVRKKPLREFVELVELHRAEVMCDERHGN